MPSSELKRFFLAVADSNDLQQQLKRTKEVADAAQIARDLGDQAEYGAQWGRGGQGYLNATGYWLNMMDRWQQLPDCAITRQLNTHSINTAQAVAEVAARCGVDKCELLLFLAQQILTLNDEQLTVIASGKRGETHLETC